ncbi:unnamed protein product [Paramecium pentaurelia]|uniref:Uncharacterized protein n=1 Tax=Paramecium pentaurelia TaxID=43138 RepID=A0A8S1TL55_9CILI|nr:unnamed protein product [Paramecium pentaurelia]
MPTFTQWILIEFFFLMESIISNMFFFNFNTTSNNIVSGILFIDRCELKNFTQFNIQQTSETKISIRSIIIKNFRIYLFFIFIKL